MVVVAGPAVLVVVGTVVVVVLPSVIVVVVRDAPPLTAITHAVSRDARHADGSKLKFDSKSCN